MATGTTVPVRTRGSTAYNRLTGHQTRPEGRPHLRRTPRPARRRRPRRGDLRRIDRPADRPVAAVHRARDDVRHPARDRGSRGLWPGHRPGRVDVHPDDLHRHRGDAIGRPHGLAGPPRAGACRTAGQGAGHPRGRLRARPGRVTARLAHGPRQPPRLPGGAGAPVGRRHATQRPDGPRDRGPRRLPAHQRAGGSCRWRSRARGRRGDPDRGPAPFRSHLPDRRRRVRDPHAGLRQRGRVPVPASGARHRARGPHRP